MSLLDVNDILFDLDIAGDTIPIIRAQRSTDDTGRTIDLPRRFTTYGNVQPASGQQLEQLDDEQRVGSFISVTVPMQLIALTQSEAPDIVFWNNQEYRVLQVMPYSNYGEGFCTATCQLISVVPAKPGI